MTRVPRLLTLTSVGLALLGAACAGLRAPDPGDGSSPIAHPAGAADLVLRVDVGGGFVPAQYHLRQLPSFSLFGDGTVITLGPQIEIYPGPALPNVLARSIDEDGIQAILRAADEAGLLGPDADYDHACVADLPTTTFTVVAGGRTHVVSAYALGFDDGTSTDPGAPPEDPSSEEPVSSPPDAAGGGAPGSTGSAGTAQAAPPSVGSSASDLPATASDTPTTVPGTSEGGAAPASACDLSKEEQAARQALVDFQNRLYDLTSWLPEGSVGPEGPFTPSALRVYVQDPAPAGDPALHQEPVAWPLSPPLASFGAVDPATGFQCGTVASEDLDLLLRLAQGANELTPWTSEGREYGLTFRPLLPDESGC
jgi:hypothetical protein